MQHAAQDWPQSSGSAKAENLRMSTPASELGFQLPVISDLAGPPIPSAENHLSHASCSVSVFWYPAHMAPCAVIA